MWPVIAAAVIRAGTRQVLRYAAVAIAGIGVGGKAVGVIKSREIAKLTRKLEEAEKLLAASRRATAADRERYAALQAELADLQERQMASSRQTESLRRRIDDLVEGLRGKQGA